MSDPLPTFVPSQETAEQAAERLWKAVTRPSEVTWDDAPPHVRAYWMQRAVDMLAGAGQRLIADSLAHVHENADAYDADQSAAIGDTATRLRTTLDLDL